jgi:hypothetical protein
MLVRFLDVVASDHPAFPFAPGQIANFAATIPATVRRALSDGRAVAIADPTVEAATVAPAEQAVTGDAKRKAKHP